MSEKLLQRRIMLEARCRGWLAYKVTGQRGLPDLILIDPDGLTHYVEVKAPSGGGVLSAAQRNTLAAIGQQGAPACVVASVADMERLFDDARLY